jgi:hypothetical protein
MTEARPTVQARLTGKIAVVTGVSDDAGYDVGSVLSPKGGLVTA